MVTDPATMEPEEDGFKPRPIRDDSEMDITPMIDIVFLLLIYFLVCSSQQMQSVLLPPAIYGTAVSDVKSLTFMVEYNPGALPTVSQMDGSRKNTFSSTPELQTSSIIQSVTEAKRKGVMDVLLKIDKDLKQKDLEEIRRAVSEVEGVKLYMAVDDSKKKED